MWAHLRRGSSGGLCSRLGMRLSSDMRSRHLFAAVALALIWLCGFAAVKSSAQSSRAPRDTDGVLQPGEVPDPRIDYSRDRLMPSAAPDTSMRKSECVKRRGSAMRQPRITIQSQAGAVVSGTVEGECITSAGLYDGDRRVSKIQVQTQPTTASFPFSLEISEASSPNIRAYMANGEHAALPIH